MGDVICSCCEETWGTVERGINKTIWQLCPCCEDYNKQLQAELAEAKKRIVLSEAQNYCKICGNTLDGYVPPEKENKDGKY